jgi:hypothetical protein
MFRKGKNEGKDVVYIIFKLYRGILYVALQRSTYAKVDKHLRPDRMIILLSLASSTTSDWLHPSGGAQIIHRSIGRASCGQWQAVGPHEIEIIRR